MKTANTTTTVDGPQAPVSATKSVTNGKVTRDEWPSATVTWLRYCYIGRWNYAKGLALAGAIGLACVPFFGWGFVGVALGLALLYVVVSCGGLLLLYGPPSQRIFKRLLQMANTNGNERVLDIHFGTYRASRVLLDLLPQATVRALGVHDPKHESEPAVLDVWKFERPPISHPRFEQVAGKAEAFTVGDEQFDLVVLGFGIHELHTDEEKSQLMAEIQRVLAPTGQVIMFERGWSPLLAFVFGPLFLHFTPAKVWHAWFQQHFHNVKRSIMFGMVDLFVASAIKTAVK